MRISIELIANQKKKKKLKTWLIFGINRGPAWKEMSYILKRNHQYSTMRILIVALCLAVGPNIFIHVSEISTNIFRNK